MKIEERPVLNGVVLDITGDLTYANREVFTAAVEAVRRKGCRHLILNMAVVRFVDSSGLGLLALVSQQFKAAQGRVSLVNPQSYVLEIMSLANIAQLMAIYDTEQAAQAGSPQAA